MAISQIINQTNGKQFTSLSSTSVRLLSSDGVDVNHLFIGQIRERHYAQLSCWLDLKPNEEKDSTAQTFETLKTTNYTQKDPLFTLRTVRRMLQDNGFLFVYDISQTPNIEQSVKSLFSCAGFIVLSDIGNCWILRKRALLCFDVPKVKGYLVKEAETPAEIESYFLFLKNRYPDSQNYCREIDDLFTHQSVIFLAYPEQNPSQVIGVARYTYALAEYGYYLPCQLATFCEGKHTGKHLMLPKNVTSVGESLSLYDKQGTGKIGTSYLVYQQLIRAILTYKHDIAHTEISYTTYLKGDETIEALYKERFGFKHTLHDNEKVCLKYGTFAGQWYLIELEQSMIKHQYHNADQIFHKHKEAFAV